MFKLSLPEVLVWITTTGVTLAAGSPPSLPQNVSKSAHCRCFPGDSCWPSPAEWSDFNRTVGGRLVATVPIASACHDSSFTPYNAERCTQLQDDWLVPAMHYTSSSSIMGQFFANMSCDPFTNRSAQCVLGTYVQYAVNATGRDDFEKVMAFASARNIRLVIRNTGHDYFGKSTGAGALALWTHYMKEMKVLEYDSANYIGKAMRVGAGVQAFESFAAAHAQGLVVAGGQCSTVGVAGGYTQGGGHSLLASTIGLSADQVLEWEVITATGQYLVATPSENADLYWALSGGGGGTYAAVLSMTVKAFPDFKVAGANLTIAMVEGVSIENFYAVVQTWLENVPAIVDAGAATLWTLLDGYFEVAPVLAPNLTAIELQDLLSPVLAQLNQSGIPYTSYIGEFSTFLDAYTEMNPEQKVTDANFGAYLIPRSIATSKTDVSTLTDVFAEMVNGTGVVTSSLSVNTARGRDNTNGVANSVNPAWRTAIHNCLFGLVYNKTSLAANIAEQDLVTSIYGAKLDALVPGGMSSYVNEGNPRQADWQRVFYGDNYDQLLAVKDKYDPKSLFYGLTAVGSDRWEVQIDGRLCGA